MFSILIPTYNNLEYLKICINSIKKNSNFKHQIIVHVNEGSDKTVEYLKKNNLKVKKVSSQKFFLERMGIIERANIISKKMTFRAQTNLYLRLKRLLDNKSMGSLFKVIFAYKNNNNNFQGFK